MELEKLQALSSLFSQLRERTMQILDCIDREHLLPNQLIPSTIALLEEAGRAQENCLKMTSSAIGVELECDTTLWEMRELLERSKEQKTLHIQEVRRVFSNFQQLYSYEQKSREILLHTQQKIVALNNQEIVALDYEREVRPYADFYRLANEKNLAVIAQEAPMLKQVFESDLVLGLFLKQIHNKCVEISAESETEELSGVHGAEGKVPRSGTTDHTKAKTQKSDAFQKSSCQEGAPRIPVGPYSAEYMKKTMDELFPATLGCSRSYFKSSNIAAQDNTPFKDTEKVFTERKSASVEIAVRENTAEETEAQQVTEEAAVEKAVMEDRVAEVAAAEQDNADVLLSSQTNGEDSKGGKDSVLIQHEELKELGIDVGMGARKIAQHLLAHDITPEHASAYQHLLDSLISENTVRSQDYTIENSLAQALVLSQTLALYHPYYDTYYRQLLLAFDAPLNDHQYDGNTVLSLFAGDMQGTSLHLATMLRALFAPYAPYDYSLKANANVLFENFELYFPKFFALKPLYNLFLQIRGISASGFSVPVLRRFSDKTVEQHVMGKIRQSAQQFLVEPIIKSRMNALVPMISRCFGKDSELRICMEIIAQDKRQEREFIQMVFGEYCDTDIGGISQSKIEDFLTQNWKKATDGIRAPRELISTPRTKILEGIRDRLNVLHKWLEVTAETQADKHESEQIQALRNKIIAEIDAVLPSLTHQCTAYDRAVLTASLISIREKLYGQLAENTKAYVDFLRTGIFFVDTNGLPIVDDTFSSVRYYEPWRNALRHIMEPVIGLEEILSRISDPKYPFLFDNIEQAVSICDYINAHGNLSYSAARYTEDIPRVRRAAKMAIANFRGKLELAFAYGHISEMLKEDIVESIESLSGEFIEHDNFGCLRAFLDALNKTIEDAKQKRYEELQLDIDERRHTNPSPALLDILDTALGKLQQSTNDFVVAEEYINRFDAGVVDDLNIHESDDENAFLQFISNDTFGRLHELCRKNQNLSLRGFGINFVESELKRRNISIQYQESAKALIRSLPNVREEAIPSTIVRLLTELGFSVLGSNKNTSTSSMVCLTAEIQPDKRDKAEYAHPVDLMGTKLKSPIDIVCLFGKMQANDIVDRVCGLELSRTAIVFLNGALDQQGRRQIAERFHRGKSGQNPFLLVDWVLLLHLALYQKTERLPVLLCCSMPYTSSFQPFVTSGSVSDEMFIGRKRELNQILDSNGPVIVYGGRQLGKTALLERALSRANHPDKKEYAVLVRSAALCKDERELTDAIICEMRSSKMDVPDVTNLDALCAELKKQYQKGNWSKLLLLIDEADAVLAEFQKTTPAYKAIIPLSSLKRDTRNDFKFVLAGLHNVCRAANDPNSIFGQLGGALCIKPLTAPDALELLSRPLRYMGFRTAAAHLEHILVNTSFYPGIVHYVGYSLVENLSTKYADYYQASHGNPPYDLTDKQLGDIMSDDALNDKINERIRWTLSVDDRYFMLARCIAYLYYDCPEDNKIGHSVGRILEYAELLEIRNLEAVRAPECVQLLLELVEMGILIQPTTDTFRLRQRRFLDAIGSTPQKIEEAIQEAERSKINV